MDVFLNVSVDLLGTQCLNVQMAMFLFGISSPYYIAYKKTQNIQKKSAALPVELHLVLMLFISGKPFSK